MVVQSWKIRNQVHVSGMQLLPFATCGFLKS